VNSCVSGFLFVVYGSLGAVSLIECIVVSKRKNFQYSTLNQFSGTSLNGERPEY
jgi:hypothetical protein